MSIIIIEGSHCSGKSTTIKNVEEIFGFCSSKSVPEWFREYIPFARSLESDSQEKIYEVGHIAAYMDAKLQDKNYIFDRWVYTTIIRLGFDENLTPDEVVAKILDFKYVPDLVICLEVPIDVVISRMQKRDGFIHTAKDFFEYENKVFEILAESSSNFYRIDNNRNPIETLEEIYMLLLKHGALFDKLDLEYPIKNDSNNIGYARERRIK